MPSDRDATRSGGGHGWLAGVIPEDARRFRVGDHDLAGALADGGAELVEDDPDVEIAHSAHVLRGDAELAIVVVDPLLPMKRRLAARVGRRVAAAVRTLANARRAERHLRVLGYSETDVLGWDVGHRAALPGAPAVRGRLVERIPRRAIVVGRHPGPPPRTALEASLAAAADQVGADRRLQWASIRAGVIVAATDSSILRVAIGPGRVQIESQAAALDRLADDSVPDSVAVRIPWLAAQGRAGLARWSLERFLVGSRPPAPLAPAFVEECVDFLISLFRVTPGDAGVSLEGQAETAAEVCGSDGAALVASLASTLEADLADVAHGFGHGDFFPGNLLCEGDRLTGVLDWDAGGSDRLPLLDLLHLQLTRTAYGPDDDWGQAVLDRLLPLARAGGNAPVRRYCAELGLDASPRALVRFVGAYWLAYVAYQIRTHPGRRREPRWIERNVERMLRELAPLVRA